MPGSGSDDPPKGGLWLGKGGGVCAAFPLQGGSTRPVSAATAVWNDASTLPGWVRVVRVIRHGRLVVSWLSVGCQQRPGRPGGGSDGKSLRSRVG